MQRELINWIEFVVKFLLCLNVVKFNNLKLDMKYIFPFLFLILVGCNRTVSPVPSDNFMILDSIEYVENFPLSYTLKENVPVEFDIIGVSDLVIQDSLLIISTGGHHLGGFWTFLNLKTGEELGSFLNVGNGPNEFLYPISAEKATYYNLKGNIYAFLYDFYRGKVYRFDITRTLQEHKLNMSEIENGLPKNMFNYIMIDEHKYYCRSINQNETQQERYIWEHGVKRVSPNMEKLNLAKIDQREDFNILSTISGKNSQGTLIVELPVNLNQINLFEIDGDFQKTICLSKKVDNIRSIQNKFKWNRIYTYGGLRTYKHFFAALYINETNKNYQMGFEKHPIIQLFSWEGNPIAEIKLNCNAIVFDIDFVHGFLYVVDDKDEIYKYEINEILSDVYKTICN